MINEFMIGFHFHRNFFFNGGTLLNSLIPVDLETKRVIFRRFYCMHRSSWRDGMQFARSDALSVLCESDRMQFFWHKRDKT